MAVRWFLVGLIVLATVATDLLQSHEMKNHGRIQRVGLVGLRHLLTSLAMRPKLIISFALMAVSFAAFVALLSISELSFAVPVTAASYSAETVLARLWLKETVQLRRWFGAVLVTAGVILIGL